MKQGTVSLVILVLFGWFTRFYKCSSHWLEIAIKSSCSVDLDGLDPVIQYRRYIQVTDRFSLNTVGGK